MPRGRRPLIEDPSIVADICAGLEEGCSFVDIAADRGIPISTFNSWLAKGRSQKPKPLYRDFLDRITRARAKGKRTLIRAVFQARKKDWRAATHMLAVMDDAWCIEKRADEKAVTKHILRIAKDALPQEHYEKLIDAIADDRGRR
jgi:hypothetical protein